MRALPPPSERAAAPVASASFVEEQSWIARIRGGDHAAFRALYERHADMMFAFAYSCLRSRDQAQDVVHDVFLAIWKNRAGWDVSTRLRSYLLRAVHNRVATMRRHLRVELATREAIVREAGTPEEWTYRAATDDALAEDDLARALERAIETLSPRAQLAYRLVREQHFSYSEAAEILGITVHTLEQHISKALKALREQLKDWRPTPGKIFRID